MHLLLLLQEQGPRLHCKQGLTIPSIGAYLFYYEAGSSPPDTGKVLARASITDAVKGNFLSFYRFFQKLFKIASVSNPIRIEAAKDVRYG